MRCLSSLSGACMMVKGGWSLGGCSLALPVSPGLLQLITPPLHPSLSSLELRAVHPLSSVLSFLLADSASSSVSAQRHTPQGFPTEDWAGSPCLLLTPPLTAPFGRLKGQGCAVLIRGWLPYTVVSTESCLCLMEEEKVKGAGLDDLTFLEVAGRVLSGRAGSQEAAGCRVPVCRGGVTEPGPAAEAGSPRPGWLQESPSAVFERSHCCFASAIPTLWSWKEVVVGNHLER